MSEIDFSDMAPKKRKPTRKERARYKRWRKYLSDSKLTIDEQHRRAATYTAQKKEPNL